MKITTSAKVSMKSLANAAQWLIKQGTRPPNRSALINACVQSLSLSIHDAGEGRLFESFEDALIYLRDEGYDFTDNSSPRQRREVTVSLAQESLRAAYSEEQQMEAEMALFEQARQLGKIKKALPTNPGIEGGEKE